MQDQLISFETAKLAKEKGFDIESDRYFNEIGELWSFHRWGEGIRPGAYFSPTQSLLQKWLREEHNLDVQAYVIEFLHNGVQRIQDAEQKTYGYIVYFYGVSQYNNFVDEKTYEQALEEGLMEALKLIK